MIKTYNDDCLNVLHGLDDNSIDLIITDPPYGVKYSKGFDDRKENVESNIDLWASELYRVLKDTSHCYIFIPIKEAGMFINAFTKEFNLMNILSTRTYTSNLYLKNNFSFNNQLILYLCKGTAKSLNKVDWVKTSDSWFKDKRNKNPREYTYQYPSFFPSDIFSNEKTTSVINNKSGRHPCAKSVGFTEILIKLSSDVGQTVLDPFMGGGTTGVACKNTGRNFIGIELNEEYYNSALTRIDN